MSAVYKDWSPRRGACSPSRGMFRTPNPSTSNADRPERRRWPRHDVEWPVTMSLDDGAPIVAIARNASLHGLGVSSVDPVGLVKIQEGARCRVEVHLAGGQARFVRVAEVRYVGEHGIGLLIAKPLPLDVAPRSRPAESAAPENRSRVPASIASVLRSVILSRRSH
jgi:hypothetical protein